MIAFGNALKDHLRRRDGSDESPIENEPAKDHGHQPIQVAGAIYQTLARCQSRDDSTVGACSGSTRK